jgi:hypothetical protein
VVAILLRIVREDSIMKPVRLAPVVLAMSLLGLCSAYAQGRGNGATKEHTNNGGGASHKPSTTTSPANTTHGNSGKPTTTTTTNTHGNGKSTTHTGTMSTSTGSSSTSTVSPTTGTTTLTTTPNALTTKVSKNPNLLAKVKAMLPAGMALNDATTGFRNQGQFIAALEACAHHPNVSFVDLQKAMTVDGLSLGQAMKKLGAETSTTGGTTSTTSTSESSTANQTRRTKRS